MEEKTLNKPKQIWEQALRVVKGDNTQALVEQFTSQMTLVAQGLADDQSRLHRSLQQLQNEQERSIQRLDDERAGLEHDTRQQLDELKRRLREQDDSIKKLEKAVSEVNQKLSSKMAADSKRNQKKTIIQQLTLPIAMICVTIIVAVIAKLL